MGRKPTRGIHRERVDYTDLLAELQSPKPECPSRKSSPAEKKAALPEISPARQKLMSDEHICYLYAKGDTVVHDKTCPEVRKVRDEDLRYSEKYPTHLHPCPHCQTKAYLRLGAKDLYNLRGYEALFEQMGISPQLQRRLYVHEGIQTEYLGPGRLKIWGKEDTWLLEAIPGSTHLRLLHNNYCPVEGGARRFVSGYHEQVVCASAKYAFSVIIGYTYAGHMAAAEQRQEPVSDLAAEGMSTLQVPPWPSRIWGRFKLWIKKLFKS